MDCGPAALKSVLEGHGIHVSYARLRDACQTDVDGTSIDTMEELAKELGLAAEQVLVPTDHLALPEARLLPAIAVVTLAERQTHFVVVWRRHGRVLQVMDPAGGRRWVTSRQFLRELYRHTSVVAAADWRAWAGSAEFTAPLVRRLRHVGLSGPSAESLVSEAVGDPSWRSLARLDAAIRLTQALVAARGLDRKTEAPALINRLTRSDTAEDAIPERYWSAVASAPRDDRTAQLAVTGAVLVRFLGRSEGAFEAESGRPAVAAMAGVIDERQRPPLVELIKLLCDDPRSAVTAALVACLIASCAVVVEALLFRAALDITRDLGTTDQRLLALAALVGFVTLLAVFDFSITAWLVAAGRQLETGLRVRFFEKARRLGDRYFQSRLTSDIVSRVHSLHLMRDVPPIAGRLVRISGEMLATTAGIIWLDPPSARLAVGLVVMVGTIAFLATPVLAEIDLRMRTHAGALSRYYFDALAGLVPLRAHGAERPLRREHDRVLEEWLVSAAALVRASVTVDALQTCIGYGLAAWLLLSHLGRVESISLLLVFWTLRIPVLADELSAVVHLYPASRNVMLRVLEPLAAADETAVVSEPPAAATSGAPIVTMKDVTVRAAGHAILNNVSLEIAAGSHVAVVGASGAGKSTLVGLLLGWHKPSAGAVLVDGRVLDDQVLAALRRRTVWVDPAINLWNRSLFYNIQYGNRSDAAHAAGFAVAASDLETLVENLPQGLETSLGEGGALVSGGEGQRVRFGRGLLRDQVRLVVLDEPFRGLARESRHSLMQRARDHWRNATLICICHDISETLDFDGVLVIDQGTLVEYGVPHLLAAAESRYRTLLAIERDVHDRLWSNPIWRHLRIDDGLLSESGKVKVP